MNLYKLLFIVVISYSVAILIINTNYFVIGYNFLYYVKVNIRYLVYILVSIYLLIKL
jgi:hypothetical protein